MIDYTLIMSNNVDIELRGESCLQDTVRRAFKSCTVLTVAHRLHTIVDCDKILVLDAGNVKEFDSPKKLLQVCTHINSTTAPVVFLQLSEDQMTARAPWIASSSCTLSIIKVRTR